MLSRYLLRKSTLLGACAMLSACAALMPAPAAPLAMPSAWSETAATDAAAVADTWWQDFDSPQLAEFIDESLQTNPDLAIAGERVRQAEAQVRVAGASLFPALDFSASTARRGSRSDAGDSTTTRSSSGSLSASYELDLWGANAAAVKAARATLRSSRYDLQSARLSLQSGLANAYFQLLSVRGRLAIARENLDIADSVFKVVSSRVRNGAASPLDLSRQQAALLSQQASIPPLELQERQTLHALAILVGTRPEGFKASGDNLDAMQIPAVSPGLPSDLLLRRPDLASVEAQMRAADANLAIARSALLPSIQLSASAGAASDVLVNFLHSPTTSWSLGAGLMQAIFQGGRLRAQVSISESRRREIVETYRKNVLAALADVEDALSANQHLREQESLQQQIVEKARTSLHLAEVRYREGADDLLSLLDAQRTLFQAQDQLAQLRLARLQATVSLFKALGGGWATPVAK